MDGETITNTLIAQCTNFRLGLSKLIGHGEFVYITTSITTYVRQFQLNIDLSIESCFVALPTQHRACPLNRNNCTLRCNRICGFVMYISQSKMKCGVVMYISKSKMKCGVVKYISQSKMKCGVVMYIPQSKMKCGVVM